MTSTAPPFSIGRQSTATVTRAELRRMLRPGGLRTWLWVSAVLATATGLLAVALSGWSVVRESGGINAADVVSTGPITAALVLALASTVHVPRDITDGAVLTSRCLVPRTGILFSARLLAWCRLTAATAVITALLPLPFALTLGDVVSSSPLRVVTAVVISCVLATVLVGLAHGAATLLQRGALVVLAGMTLLIVVPLVTGIASTLTTGFAATVIDVLSRISLGALLVGALQAPTADGQPWGAWVWSLVGLATWLGLTTAAAYRRFRHPGYGDR